MKDLKTDDFKYKIFWYNNILNLILTTNGLKIENKILEVFVGSNRESTKFSMAVFWDFICELK